MSTSGRSLLSYKIICVGEVGGPEHGSAVAYVVASPQGTVRRAFVAINDKTACKIAAATSKWLARGRGSYDEDPDSFERDAHVAFSDAAPELMTMIAYAREAGAVITEVVGLPVPTTLPKNSQDGVIAEEEVRQHAFNLAGAIAGGWGLRGFAYFKENDGRLLKAVTALVGRNAAQTRRVFATDLMWQSDNADRQIPDVPDIHPGGAGPMYPYRGLSAIRPARTAPIEAVALADLVNETARHHGSAIIDQLQRPDYAIDNLGGRGVEGIPLLVWDDRGRVHGRLHAGRVTGLTPDAQHAFDIFCQVVMSTSSVMEVIGNPGSLLLVSNTQAMHRKEFWFNEGGSLLCAALPHVSRHHAH